MTELNKPKITVDELLQAVRVELGLSQGHNSMNDAPINGMNPINTEDISYIEELINNAEFRATTRTKWPDKYNRFPFNLSKKIQRLALKALEIIFIDQREVNFSLLQALKKSILVNQKLSEEIVELKEQVKASEEKFIKLYNQYNSKVTDSLKPIEQQISDVEAWIKKLSDRYITTKAQFETIEQQTNNLHRHYFNDYNYFKNDLSQQKRLITLFLEEVRQHLPDKLSRVQLQKFGNEEQHLLDVFYAAFEEQFRGSQEEITDRLKVYLPWIEAAKVGTQELPILDIGCGRGEWLELLHLSGFLARGLDINRIMVEQCQAKGFDIVEKDALAYLQSLPTSSIGAVTGFHIIEHLPFDVLVDLLNETNRVLTSGGVAIFETPNPENVLVGSCTFYLDPTHRNPLPSQTIKFVVEYCNFCNVQILNLNRPEVVRVPDDSEIAQRFNEYFYGYRDYAVIGFKP